MAETTTYAQLLSDIQTYCEDDSSRLAGEIPGIMGRASDRLQMDMDLDIFDGSQEFTISNGNKSQLSSTATGRPSGMLRTKSIFIAYNSSQPGTGYPLQRRSLAFINMLGPVNSLTNQYVVPLYFHERQTDIVVGPTPNANYDATLIYCQRLAALSATNTTNWFTNNQPRLLLYACLIEAEVVLDAPQQQQVYEQRYQMELQRAMKEIRGLERQDYVPLYKAPGNVAAAPPPPPGPPAPGP